MYIGTALHRAVKSGNFESVRLLVEKGADREIKGKDGKTPLQVAKSLGLEDIAGILRNVWLLVDDWNCNTTLVYNKRRHKRVVMPGYHFISGKKMMYSGEGSQIWPTR
jgi:ankyrin repeat protein